MWILMIIYLLLVIFVLFGVAFLTLFERKLLGHMHLRKGPNKLIFKGGLQPLSDGLKLLSKENINFFLMNKLMYLGFPGLSFFLMLVVWSLFDFLSGGVYLNSMIVFIMLSGLGVYGVLGMGWSSNSKYSLLGSYRVVAQTVSYEVGLVFMVVSLMYICKSYSLISLVSESKLFYKIYGVFMFLIIWLVIILAELNRAPFDFAESESELVSGFNVEYGSGKFVLMFLAEYGNIIFMSYMTLLLFFSSVLAWEIMLTLFFLVWVRGSFPRFRYDNLMYMNWMIFLPLLLMLWMMMIFMDIYVI